MALIPPVSAISGTIGPCLAASARLMAWPTSVDPVKAMPATRGSAVSAAPVFPSPRTRCSALTGTPAPVQEANGLDRHQRGLLGGLRHHRIASRQRRDDLAEKYRQREIPRADTDEHAAAAVTQLVRFTGRSRHRLRRQRAARLGGVIAAI